MSMLEQLNNLAGKRVCISFESKKFNGEYRQTGILLRANEDWTYLDDWSGRTTYPRGSTAVINTSRIRDVREIAMNVGDTVRVRSDFCIVPDVIDWLIEQKNNRFEVVDVSFSTLKARLRGCPFEMDVDNLEVVA